MSKDKRQRAKGRRSGHSFLQVPHPVMNSPAYCSLSAIAVKMLFDLAVQYKGKNNGDLVATMSFMETRNWNSNAQIKKAINELLDKSLIVLTRQGRRPRVASLYALTWRPIDECGGKLEEVKATQTAPDNWKQFRFSDHHHAVQSEPHRGAMGVGKVVSLHRQAVQ
jgi:hypothetical protein